MLHIHGGDIVLERIARGGIPGERLSWREVLCDGPTPVGLAPEAWRHVRAAFLEAATGISAEEIKHGLSAQSAQLEDALMQQDQIVLWFSSDWFCQAILLHLCWLIHQRPSRRARLFLIGPTEWPGIPESAGCVLAHIPLTDLTRLFEQRSEVAPSLLHTASLAWEAILAPEPGAVAALAARGFPELPSLKDGLTIHVTELPAGSGLGLSEELALAALDDQPRPWGHVFSGFKAREPHPWVTDLMFLDRLRRLSGGATPLVEWNPDRTEVRRTQAGGEVLAGERDWCALNPPDRWVGGVHLTTTNLWRIDRRTLTLNRE